MPANCRGLSNTKKKIADIGLTPGNKAEIKSVGSFYSVTTRRLPGKDSEPERVPEPSVDPQSVNAGGKVAAKTVNQKTKTKP